jgi:aspartyl-tRNA(Asn)/glutamyl-tRNA(Gln) amidotransferase subunit C
MITKDEVRHIAELARIGLNDKEIEKYQKDMSAILDWIEQLKEVDIKGIQPTAHITGLKNIVRVDKSDDFENKAGIIDLFPEKKDNYDKVKSIF